MVIYDPSKLSQTMRTITEYRRRRNLEEEQRRAQQEQEARARTVNPLALIANAVLGFITGGGPWGAAAGAGSELTRAATAGMPEYERGPARAGAQGIMQLLAKQAQEREIQGKARNQESLIRTLERGWENVPELTQYRTPEMPGLAGGRPAGTLQPTMGFEGAPPFGMTDVMALSHTAPRVQPLAKWRKTPLTRERTLEILSKVPELKSTYKKLLEKNVIPEEPKTALEIFQIKHPGGKSVDVIDKEKYEWRMGQTEGFTPVFVAGIGERWRKPIPKKEKPEKLSVTMRDAKTKAEQHVRTLALKEKMSDEDQKASISAWTGYFIDKEMGIAVEEPMRKATGISIPGIPRSYRYEYEPKYTPLGKLKAKLLTKKNVTMKDPAGNIRKVKIEEVAEAEAAGYVRLD